MLFYEKNSQDAPFLQMFRFIVQSSARTNQAKKQTKSNPANHAYNMFPEISHNPKISKAIEWQLSLGVTI